MFEAHTGVDDQLLYDKGKHFQEGVNAKFNGTCRRSAHQIPLRSHIDCVRGWKLMECGLWWIYRCSDWRSWGGLTCTLLLPRPPNGLNPPPPALAWEWSMATEVSRDCRIVMMSSRFVTSSLCCYYNGLEVENYYMNMWKMASLNPGASGTWYPISSS